MSSTTPNLNTPADRPEPGHAGIFAWLAMLGLLLPATLQAAYLPIIGPAPVRFQVCSQWVAPVVTPPLPPVAPSTASPGEEATGSEVIPDPGAPVVLTAKSPTSEGTNALPWYSQGATGNQEMVSPQMMVPFFQRRYGETNGLATDVYGQIPFTPPVPSGRPASKATYSTP